MHVAFLMPEQRILSRKPSIALDTGMRSRPGMRSLMAAEMLSFSKALLALLAVVLARLAYHTANSWRVTVDKTSKPE